MSDSYCVCGKPVTGKTYCSERCKYIIEGMRTPYGMNMSLERAVQFFGKRWDKKHGGEKTK